MCACVSMLVCTHIFMSPSVSPIKRMFPSLGSHVTTVIFRVCLTSLNRQYWTPPHSNLSLATRPSAICHRYISPFEVHPAIVFSVEL